MDEFERVDDILSSIDDSKGTGEFAGEDDRSSATQFDMDQGYLQPHGDGFQARPFRAIPPRNGDFVPARRSECGWTQRLVVARRT